MLNQCDIQIKTRKINTKNEPPRCSTTLMHTMHIFITIYYYCTMHNRYTYITQFGKRSLKRKFLLMLIQSNLQLHSCEMELISFVELVYKIVMKEFEGK